MLPTLKLEFPFANLNILWSLDILEEVDLLGVKLAKFPMEQNLKLTPTDGDLLKDPTHYC